LMKDPARWQSMLLDYEKAISPQRPLTAEETQHHIQAFRMLYTDDWT
jgi:hypothetical protein